MAKRIRPFLGAGILALALSLAPKLQRQLDDARR